MGEKSKSNDTMDNITADIIILGCSLPGIVAANKLKQKFGATMDIVVLELAGDVSRHQSLMNVSFHIETPGKEEVTPSLLRRRGMGEGEISPCQHFILKYAGDFKLELPEGIIHPEYAVDEGFNQIFEARNGNTTETSHDYHSYKFANIFQRFELNQFQTSLNESLSSVYLQPFTVEEVERLELMHYDNTSMEDYIQQCLFLESSRDIMRSIVRIACGSSADKVSVLFYLHQSHRVNGADHHIGGTNTRLRERVLSYCRRRLIAKLMDQVADIKISTMPIEQIRTFMNDQVILETIEGEAYVCTLLALALRPEQLHDIHLEDRLLSHRSDIEMILSLSQSNSKRFAIRYKDNFWRNQGFSGDIFSVKGPILWAMEKPKLSGTGSEQKYHTLVGYLKVSKGAKDENSAPIDNKTAIVTQLVKLFGEGARNVAEYKETDFIDLYIPRCGDYVGLQRLMDREISSGLEWGALDIFGEGDLGAALEAGHKAYLHLLNTLRPQARSYTEITAAEWPHVLPGMPVTRYWSSINYINSAKIIATSCCAYCAYLGISEVISILVW